MHSFIESLTNIWLVAFYVGVLIGYLLKSFVFANTKEVHPLNNILERLENDRKSHLADKQASITRKTIERKKERLLIVSKECKKLNEELTWYDDLNSKGKLTNHGLECWLVKKGAFGSISEEKRILEAELKEL
ncbi:MAG: hypothetical protein M0R32_08365, partial [Candidatus Cloacimonetes bacterium]|nr:hypothetical protein [Candidatus Cloacimonadota bacterium]